MSKLEFRGINRGGYSNDVVIDRVALIDWMCDEVYFENGTDVGTSIEDAKLMQYIGVKDKNGVKVFEGDLLRKFHFKSADGSVNYLYHLVVWSDKFNGWFAESSDGETGSLQFWVYNKNDFEVVRNITSKP